MGRIFDRLSVLYGSHVFFDIHGIPFAADFRAHIDASLASSGIVLAVIGKDWVGRSAVGESRIHNKDDFVRYEIEAALRALIPVCPVLVEGAGMPKPQDIPETLLPLRSLNALSVSSGIDFDHQVERLVETIDRALPQLARRKPRATSSLLSRMIEFGRSPTAWGTIIFLTMPFAASYASIEPPWPRGAALMTGAVSIVALLFVNRSLMRAGPARARRLVLASSVVLIVASCGYAVADSLLTYEIPTTGGRRVKGFECSAMAAAVYIRKCPWLGTDELKDAEYEAERLWTSRSVTASRLLLVVSWLALFGAGAILLGGLRALHAIQSGSKSE